MAQLTFRRGANIRKAFLLDDVEVTPTAAELNLLAGNTATAAMLNQADYDAGAHAVAVVDFNTGAAEAACSITVGGVVYQEADVAVAATGVWTNGATAATSATSFAAAINGDTRAAVPMTATVAAAGESVFLTWDAVGTAGNVTISTTSAGNVTVENSHGGLAAGRRRIYAVNYVVTAQDVLAAQIVIPLPFAPISWIENAKSTAGLLKAHTGLVTVGTAPNRISIDNSAGATHLAATDVVHLVVTG
jgi:hypothetical protein